MCVFLKSTWLQHKKISHSFSSLELYVFFIHDYHPYPTREKKRITKCFREDRESGYNTSSHELQDSSIISWRASNLIPSINQLALLVLLRLGLNKTSVNHRRMERMQEEKTTSRFFLFFLYA